jgi:hypothetical protein
MCDCVQFHSLIQRLGVFCQATPVMEMNDWMVTIVDSDTIIRPTTYVQPAARATDCKQKGGISSYF